MSHVQTLQNEVYYLRKESDSVKEWERHFKLQCQDVSIDCYWVLYFIAFLIKQQMIMTTLCVIDVQEVSLICLPTAIPPAWNTSYLTMQRCSISDGIISECYWVVINLWAHQWWKNIILTMAYFSTAGLSLMPCSTVSLDGLWDTAVVSINHLL